MDLISLVRIKVWLTRTRLWAELQYAISFSILEENQLTLTYTWSVLPLKVQCPHLVHDILMFRKSSLEVKNNLKFSSNFRFIMFKGFFFFANTKEFLNDMHMIVVFFFFPVLLSFWPSSLLHKLLIDDCWNDTYPMLRVTISR